MNQKTAFLAIFFPLLLILGGCSENSLNLQVRFAEVSGLKQNDAVIFRHNDIGKVQKISYTQQGDYLVLITISPEFKNAATVDSKFFIDDDPRQQQNKGIAIVQEKPGGKILEKDAVVQGAVKTKFLDDLVSGIKRNVTVAENEMRGVLQQLEKSLTASSQKLTKEMAVALDDLTRQFHMFSEEVKNVPNRQEVVQLEMSIKQFADEFNKAQNDVREHILKEVLPHVRKKLDLLREQLHREGRDKELEGIDKQVNEMIRV